MEQGSADATDDPFDEAGMAERAGDEQVHAFPVDPAQYFFAHGQVQIDLGSRSMP